MQNSDKPVEDNEPLLRPPAPPRTTAFDTLSLFVRTLPPWLFAGISLVGIFFLYQFVGGLLTFFLFGTDLSEGNVQTFRIATMFGQVLFLLVPTLVLAKLRFPNTPNVFRFGPVSVVQIVLVAVAVFTLQQLMQAYLLWQESLPVSVPPIVQDLIDQIKKMMETMYRLLTKADSLGEFIFVVTVIALTPAVCEELLFRGLIQRTLEEPERSSELPEGLQRRKALAAAVVAGVIFGLYHVNPFTLIPLAVLGVFFGYVVYRSQNIVTAIVAHFVNNFIACLAIYLHLDDAFVAIAPTSPPSSEMVMINAGVCLVVFLAATSYFVRITNRNRSQIGHITQS